MSASHPLRTFDGGDILRSVRTRAAISTLSLLIVGCGDGTPPTAYKHPRDQFFAAVPLPFINDDFMACFRRNEGQPSRLPDRECYRFTEPQRMRGVALTGFETGSFHPARTTLPQSEERSEVWIGLEPHVLPQNVRGRCMEGCAVYLDFVGRRTAVEGGYGHMGLRSHMVVVDRVLEANVLGERPFSTHRGRCAGAATIQAG